MAEHKTKPISAAQALMVRKLLDRGDLTIHKVAKEVGVSYNTAQRIHDMTDTEWEQYLEKRERLDRGEYVRKPSNAKKPAKPKKAVKKAVKKPEPKPEPVPEPEPAEEPAGVCPKCGAVKPDAKAAWCWKCGADLRSERAKTVVNLAKIAGVLNKAIELLEAE